MNVTKIFHVRSTIVAVFILALLCRGQWMGPQSLHSVSVDNIPNLSLALDHTSHPDHFIDHHHSMEAKVADLTHALLHALGVMDSHIPVVSFGLLHNSFLSSPVTAVTKSLLDPKTQLPFRPPRFV